MEYETLQLSGKEILIPEGWIESIARESKEIAKEIYDVKNAKPNELYKRRLHDIKIYLDAFGNAYFNDRTIEVEIPQPINEYTQLAKEHLITLLDAISSPFEGKLDSLILYARKEDLLSKFLEIFGFGDTYKIKTEDEDYPIIQVTIATLPKKVALTLESLLLKGNELNRYRDNL